MAEDASARKKRNRDNRRNGQLKQAAGLTGVDVETWKLLSGMGQRWCSDCRQWKQIGEFAVDKSRITGRQQCCKPCAKIRAVACTYRISKEQAREILSRNECEICLRRDVAFEVDHCHTTGKVRGLLCSRCNSAIGLFLESAELMDAAKSYLAKHNG